jgi:hypothetical protein
MLQFMKMWFWGGGELGPDNEWSGLKKALEEYYLQNQSKV